MTIEWIIGAVCFGLLGIIISVFTFKDFEILRGIMVLLITAIIVGAILGVGYWICNNTAQGVRALKDQKSNFNNGIEREITITAEDGREIYHYSGKCDIETQDNYIIFEDENNKRQMIYWGITDTIIVSEK